MNKRQRKKQRWLKWIGGSHQIAKQRKRKEHEELIAFKRKAWAKHLTNDDIDNFYIDLSLFPQERVKDGSIFVKRRKRRGCKTSFKKINKILAQEPQQKVINNNLKR